MEGIWFLFRYVLNFEFSVGYCIGNSADRKIVREGKKQQENRRALLAAKRNSATGCLCINTEKQ